MITRNFHIKAILDALSRSPVVAILGPRQVGKTTLAREIARLYGGQYTHFDLEDFDDLARLSEPKLALAGLVGLVIIDEIQLRPNLFSLLRVLVDRPGHQSKFLVLGSASPHLLRQSSETLAGRIVYHELDGFYVDEVTETQRLWLRGGFPSSFLASSDKTSSQWRRDFIRTFLERDLPQLGIKIPAPTLHRFWHMIAHYHGQIWNGSELARAFGISHTTVRNYLDIMSGAMVVRQLQPWHENLAKRQVKAPKVYLTDCGLLHTLLNIQNQNELETHPKIGASWEWFVLREIMHILTVEPQECYFWATHNGAELDLLIMRGQKRFGFEIKRTTAPRMTSSIRSAMETLKLDLLVLVHAGEHSFPLADHVDAVSFAQLKEHLQQI